MIREDIDQLVDESVEVALRATAQRLDDRRALQVAEDLVDTSACHDVAGDAEGADLLNALGRRVILLVKSRTAARVEAARQRTIRLKTADRRPASRREPTEQERLAAQFWAQYQTAIYGPPPTEQQRREADQEAQRRLDAIAAGEKRQQEAELARRRAHDEAAASEPRAQSWREAHGGAPTRGLVG